MEAIKVELEGVTTSFRYPYLMIGRQLSFPVPPPATIYGHICSAVGDFIDPSDLKAAYSFLAPGTVDDLELLYIATPGSGKIKGWEYPAALDCGEQPQPTKRELLFYPKLTLYLWSKELERLYTAMRSPRYTVVLGRSQDLAAYRNVEKVELVKSNEAYCDGSLLPLECRFHTTAGTVYRLPRFIDPDNRFKVEWGDYLYAPYIVTWGAGKSGPKHIEAKNGDSFWIDPASKEIDGKRRVVYWLTFKDELTVDKTI
ncbi:MAG: CRISPR-associated protein Cas5 [Firmicutes bacterium]|nr:CRISPR-associated protein Cas5 [Bacillota bacterium]